jgi:hypothetical protein
MDLVDGHSAAPLADEPGISHERFELVDIEMAGATCHRAHLVLVTVDCFSF